MTVKPKISILTASKNGARFLRQTVESILQQSFTDFEHVLVDGVSTDDTLKILEEYKHIRWISEPDKHSDEGYYKAIKMAKGEYIMVCCVSDGYLDKNWFGECARVLDNDPEVSLVYGLPRRMSEDGTLGRIVSSVFLAYPPPQKTEHFPFWLGTFSVYPEITFCVRANVFEECFPKYEPSDSFLQNHALLSFNYNFNVRGYLPYFLPVVASYGRYHRDSNSVKLTKGNKVAKKQYQSAVAQYANEVFEGTKKHVFRDGRSNVIGAVEPQQLKLFRPKVLDYRINRRYYLGKRRSGGLGHYIRKLKILMGYFFAGKKIRC